MYPGHYPAGHPGLLYDPQLLEELYQRGLLEEAPAMGTVPYIVIPLYYSEAFKYVVFFFIKILTFHTKSWFLNNEHKDQSQQIYEKQTKQTPAAEAFPNQFRIKYRPIYFR